MCGIVGYVGNQQAVDVLMSGLSKLEYRGYDSVGISLFMKEKIITQKSKGRIQEMLDKIDINQFKPSHVGIGHTRWATHGEPSDINSHPHGNHRVSIVHNGIIENYAKIKERMIRKGYQFVSETDTEAIAKCLDYYYVQRNNPVEAIIKLIEKMDGSYALGMMFADHKDTIYAVRKDSPLLIGLGENENFIASDMTALLKHTKRYYLLEANEIAIITKEKVAIINLDQEPIQKEVQTADWDEQTAEKAGYPHFMLKEIHEQKNAFLRTLSVRYKTGHFNFEIDHIKPHMLENVQKIHIVACGTAMHAGMIGQVLLQRFAHADVVCEIASEFRYRDPILKPNDLVIIVSQSGETADSLAALRLAKERNIRTLAIVNVAGSSISREADMLLMTHAGIEIAVASTKAFYVQTALLSAFAIYLGRINKTLTEVEAKQLSAELMEVEHHLDAIFLKEKEMQHKASLYQSAQHLFFIGRGLDFLVALESSLKLKEISYIHSEAYPAGELKHGTISLITDEVPVVAIATQTNVFEKTISNIKEVKARGANVLLLKKENMRVSDDVADEIINLPDLADWTMPLVSIILLQLFAYYMSVLRGCDVDKPRNLAKSVTVE
jgi:glutamine---fructose-6-phosphate transaminase (isomerizing)